MLTERLCSDADVIDRVIGYVGNKDHRAFRFLRSGIVSVNAEGTLKLTPLFFACYGLWEGGVTRLLELGASLECGKGYSAAQAVMLGFMDDPRKATAQRVMNLVRRPVVVVQRVPEYEARAAA